MRIASKNLVVNNDLGASFNSDPVFLDSMNGFSMEVVITTADANGTFKLQTSNDDVNWVDYPSSSDSVIGADKNMMYNVSVVYFRYARLVYTRASGGAGVTLCNVYFHAKGQNAS